MPRLVLISDTHEKHAGLVVPDGDILVHAGDLTMMGRPGKIKEAGEWFASLPHKHKIYVAGNHDFLFESDLYNARFSMGMHLDSRKNVYYLENGGTELEGLKFWGSPITPMFYNWAFMRDRGKPIRWYWNQIPHGLDVLITHGPPRGRLDQANAKLNTEHCGCDDLLMAVVEKKPRMHVFGHIHGGYGFQQYGETATYNAAVLDESYALTNAPFVVDLEPR